MSMAELSDRSVQRAHASAGTNAPVVYAMASSIIRSLCPRGGRLVDVGCGRAALWQLVSDFLGSYVGVDLVRHDSLPDNAEFFAVDLNAQPLPLPDQHADIVAALGIVEYLENPRALMRELVRVAKPGALFLISTPNHLNLLSKATLLLKNRFNAMQDRNPSHPITAMVESDLQLMASDCGVERIETHYSGGGRIPLTARHWARLPGLRGRAFSDVVLISGRRSGGGSCC